ncbi:MAG TPA: hypothetical protein VFD58_09505 [Blastocatellia bacterium]|nr:hypothetical protein [Blastocatellia bacterium]
MMVIKIKDELQLNRYKKLSPGKRAKVDQIIKRHLAACAELKVEPETELTFREAIDMVSNGKWEPDRPVERPDLHWQYQVYVSPRKEAA